MSDWYARNFTHDEMACKCCGKQAMDPAFMRKLQKARDAAGIAFEINSGYRCEVHNKAVGGKDNSSHRRGCAVDIRADNPHTREVISAALTAAGFTRRGVASNFIHVDDDPEKTHQQRWLY